MKTYQQTFAATVPVRIKIAGRHFRLIDCASPVLVEFFDEGGQQKDETMSGVNFGTWAEPQGGFWEVQITSSATQTIKFAISKGRAGIDQSVGTVTVANPEPILDRLEAGNLFSVSLGLVSAAGQFAQFSIKNPSGSGKVIVVERAQFGIEGAAPAAVTFYDSVNDVGSIAGSATGAINVHRATGATYAAPTVAVVKTVTSASTLGSYNLMGSVWSSAFQMVEALAPFEIAEGATFYVVSGVADRDLLANVVWSER